MSKKIVINTLPTRGPVSYIVTRSMRDYVLAHGKALLAALCVVVGLSLVIFRLTSLAGVFGVRATWVMTDFKTAIYYPVVAFLSGENPYAVERFMQLYPVDAGFPLYLPMTLLVHLPFGLLATPVAFYVYFAISLVLLFLVSMVSLTFNRLPLRTTHVFLIGGLLLLSRPGHWNLLVGQPVLQLVLASYVALYFAGRSSMISALGLALSTMKPTFGIPIALLMLAQGYVRPVLYAGIISALINAPLLLILALRAGGIGSFWVELIKNIRTWEHEPVVSAAASIIRLDVTAFLSRFLGQPLGNTLQIVVFLGILTVAAVILLRMAAFEDHKFQTLTISIICVATLLCVHHQAYDILLLTLPFVGLVFRRFPREFYVSPSYPISVALLILLFINYAASHSVMRFIPSQSHLWLTVNSLNSFALLSLFVIWVRAASKITAALSSNHLRYPSRLLPG